MTRVKVIGAGSIGNHLSNASRRLGWDVDICDLDPKALERTRNEIYPGRYGEWDSGIGLYHTDEVPRGGYDYIFIGTPPDSHMDLALAALKEEPRAILVEKPLCTPSLEGAAEFHALARDGGVAAFCGYDHAVSQGVAAAVSEPSLAALGEAMKLVMEGLKQVVEPTGVLALAGLAKVARERPQEIAGSRIGVILSGGNVDLDRLAKLLSDGV